eukprot:scaffold25985_cov51-Isochrysis_galbana.AAC.1
MCAEGGGTYTRRCAEGAAPKPRTCADGGGSQPRKCADGKHFTKAVGRPGRRWLSVWVFFSLVVETKKVRRPDRR